MFRLLFLAAVAVVAVCVFVPPDAALKREVPELGQVCRALGGIVRTIVQGSDRSGAPARQLSAADAIALARHQLDREARPVTQQHCAPECRNVRCSEIDWNVRQVACEMPPVGYLRECRERCRPVQAESPCLDLLRNGRWSAAYEPGPSVWRVTAEAPNRSHGRWQIDDRSRSIVGGQDCRR